MFTSVKKTAGFVAATADRKPFPYPDGARAFSLDGGRYIAEPFIYVHRAAPYSAEELARMALLNNNWEPKGSAGANYPQRCPVTWVDNVCIYYTAEMAARNEEPQVVLGRWTKEQEQYGKKVKFDGLVLSGGGHYERMGNKVLPPTPSSCHYGHYLQQPSVKFESGDESLRAAADKELKEEIGVDPRNVRATLPLMIIDDPLSDPRVHGLRVIYLRWIEQTPRPTDELREGVAATLSDLKALCDRSVQYTSAKDGKELGLILNHDHMLKLVFETPRTNDFLAYIRSQFDSESRSAPNVSRAF